MLEKELRLAKEAAIQAGNILMQAKAHVETQAGKDIKLDLDTRSERAIFDCLRASGYTILSEEKGLIKGQNPEFTWIVDPLDGTANYWKGLKELSCVSVALWNGETPVLGVVNRFHTRDMYVGIVGCGAWKNDEPIMPSGTAQTDQAVLATGLPLCRDYSAQGLKGFIQAMQRFKKVRMLGSAALMGCFVAEGKVDAYMEDEIMLWDVAAAAAIAKAAGAEIEIHPTMNHQCICKFFANTGLKESYYADCV